MRRRKRRKMKGERMIRRNNIITKLRRKWSR
jgi:hypothetical protein